tara:strand:+ start:305 stop:592 length:288 start_codon:yes stop_codon:yes gene_type:complete
MLQIEFTDPLQIRVLNSINYGPVVIAKNSDLDSIAKRLSVVATAERSDGSTIQSDSVIEAYYGILEAFSFALDLIEMPRVNGDLIASLMPFNYWR